MLAEAGEVRCSDLGGTKGSAAALVNDEEFRTDLRV